MIGLVTVAGIAVAFVGLVYLISRAMARTMPNRRTDGGDSDFVGWGADGGGDAGCGGDGGGCGGD